MSTYLAGSFVTDKGNIPIYGGDGLFDTDTMFRCACLDSSWPSSNTTIRYNLVRGGYIELSFTVSSNEGNIIFNIYDSENNPIAGMTNAYGQRLGAFGLRFPVEGNYNIIRPFSSLYQSVQVDQPGDFLVGEATFYAPGFYGTGQWDISAVSDSIELYEPDEDPYNNPGEGDFDDGSSDNIGIPSLPNISAADTGFITLYNPSSAQLKSLASYLWSDLFSVDTFKKLFSDPMQAILGLSILPIAVPSGENRVVRVGNISTGVSLPVASQQFIEVDCGTIKLKRQSPGTYLDFSPYTKVDLYLPFIGTHPLDVDEVMNKNINVVYHVDILSGACTAFVKVGSSIMYQFIGSCAISVPITGNDWTNAINGVMNIAGSIGSMVLTGGATAPMAAGVIASTVTNNLKPNVEKSGAVSGSGGLMGVKRPYLIINRPRRNVANNQNKYIGYPAWKTKTLKNLSGYNSIEDVHLENIPATEAELVEIKRLLKQGVIF